MVRGNEGDIPLTIWCHRHIVVGSSGDLKRQISGVNKRRQSSMDNLIDKDRILPCLASIPNRDSMKRLNSSLTTCQVSIPLSIRGSVIDHLTMICLRE